MAMYHAGLFVMMLLNALPVAMSKQRFLLPTVTTDANAKANMIEQNGGKLPVGEEAHPSIVDFMENDDAEKTAEDEDERSNIDREDESSRNFRSEMHNHIDAEDHARAVGPGAIPKNLDIPQWNGEPKYLESSHSSHMHLHS